MLTSAQSAPGRYALPLSTLAPLSVPLSRVRHAAQSTIANYRYSSCAQHSSASLARDMPSLSRHTGVAAALGSSSSQSWWERDCPPNMKEANGVQELIDALADAGDRLVIVDFYAQWCNACRGVFPKICKLVGERQEDVIFIKVNFDVNRDMAKTMGVKVLPFFQFYRGGEGKVDQFSCTVSKIQRFKDALDVYTTPFCSLEPPPGVQEFPDVRPHPELHPEYAQGVFVPAYEWGEAHEDELHPLADTPTVIGQLRPLTSMAGSEGQGSAGVALAAAAAPAEEVQRKVALSA